MKPIFGVLGPLLTPAGTIGAAKHRILLAGLLLRTGEPVSVEELTGQLWEFDPPAQPRAAIQTYVRRLRQSLGASVIRTSGRGYLAEVPPESVDVFRFRELVRSAEAAGAAERSRLLGEALRLWRGQPLADVPSQLLRERHVARLTDGRIRAMELRFAVELETSGSGELVAGLRAATAEFPLHEEFWAQLMTALYRSDRQAEALEAFAEAAEILKVELGVGTGPRLRELHQMILTQDGSIGSPRPLAPAHPTVLPAQLPLDIPDFVGRTEASAKIISLLRKSVPVIISGPPGVGKTALAIRIGHTLRRDFPDGQLHVNLRGFDVRVPMSPAQVLSRFLRGLGVAAEQIPVEQQELAARYQECVRNRRILVVLDNAASIEQVHDLLPTGPGCGAIITSRNKLSELTEAHHQQLDVLTLSESKTLLSSTLGSAVVAAEPQKIDTLANLCSFLPLALRIAAANIASSRRPNLHGFIAELQSSNRLNNLSISGDEQSAVQTAFDLSYLALGSEEQKLFARLSLVPGSDFTLAEAAVLMQMSPDQVEPALNHLSSAHLIQKQHENRYSLHDLLRLYSSHQLRESAHENQSRDLKSALYGHYLTSARAACATLYPGIFHLYPEEFPTSSGSVFTSVELARSWLESEVANLAAVITRALEEQFTETAWGIADAIRRYIQSAGMHLEQLAIGSSCLESAQEVGNRPAEAYMLATISQSYFKSANYEKSRKAALEAQVIYRELRSDTGMLHTSNMLGLIDNKTGDIDSAIRHYESSLSLSNASGNRVGGAIALNNLSSAYWMTARLDDFYTAAEATAESAQELGISELLMVAQVNMAAALNSIGQFSKAIPVAEKSLLDSKRVGAKENQILAYNEAAIAHYNLGQYAAALKETEGALEVSHSMTLYFAEAYSLSLRSLILNKVDDADAAIEFSNRAVRLSEEKGLPENLSFALNCRSNIRRTGALESAIQDASRAVTISREHGHLLREHQGLTTLASACTLAGELKTAQETATAALNCHVATGHVPGQAHTLHVLGDVAQKAGETTAALSYWQEAHKLFCSMRMMEAAEVGASIAAARD
ncbi:MULTISPECIES: BTAD domain-containing putative transcriptional regulator [unclassified Crossiella]|uniref:AfsR/SARP family transcriptional regulator n=1 Tax=unclassified Crossiella TaxID=2620835 RepID=UPI001FFEDB65|nr:MULTISPECIES: BTAD domain-containing putative transcriptional regulator [unclassified Crossiella]MCK2236899.1 AAA family ATPase [Crossiella sp. S99.2]MCK2250567.1 AAA family ATPase [Crossiella sp. S99.1]